MELRDMTSSNVKKTSLGVVMTCFNRKALTISALESLHVQNKVDHIDMTVYLLDDASQDGTRQAVSELFPSVQIAVGNGSLYWNGGMRVAFAQAMANDHDMYLWFNDDTLLEPDALSRIVRCGLKAQEHMSPTIVTGSTRDPETDKWTYGGWRVKATGLRMNLVPVYPSNDSPLDCDTMNGNFTLIPRGVAQRIGNLDAHFQHQLGDWDYGLRAAKSGCRIVVAPGYYGRCSDNAQENTWRDEKSPFALRWKHLMSPKGAPPAEWLLYTTRHYGWRWLFYALSPYLKVLTLSKR
jgi:GT2 family glycosyltransferase